MISRVVLTSWRLRTDAVRSFTKLVVFIALVACGFAATAATQLGAIRMDVATARALDACIAKERQLPGAEPWERLVDMRERCPLVHDWLQREKREQRLLLDNITAPHHDSLIELRRLIGSAKRVDGTLRRAALDDVLAGLSFSAEPEPGWWKRLVTWLRSHFNSSDADLQWLAELIETLTPPESVMEFFFKGSLLLLILLALLLVGNEVRLFGWRGRAPDHRGTGVTPGDGPSLMPQWDELSTLPPRQQVSAALRLLVQAASETRAVDALVTSAAADRSRPESRTPRELLLLVSRSHKHSHREQSGTINLLVTQVEGVIYGDEELDQPQASALRVRCQQVAQALLLTSEHEQGTRREPAAIERDVASQSYG